MDHANGPDFSKNHNDIKITKEEAEFLEKQFLKYLTREMEKNSSNWQEFYDILKQETGNTSTNGFPDTNQQSATEGGFHGPSGAGIVQNL